PQDGTNRTQVKTTLTKTLIIFLAQAALTLNNELAHLRNPESLHRVVLPNGYPAGPLKHLPRADSQAFYLLLPKPKHQPKASDSQPPSIPLRQLEAHASDARQ